MGNYVEYTYMQRWNTEGSRLRYLWELSPHVQQPSGKRERKALFLCDCGTVFPSQVRHWKSGGTLSCGCLNSERSAERYSRINLSHGMSGTPIYYQWKSMIEKDVLWGYKHCARWSTFENFFDDMQATYFDDAAIIRINHEGEFNHSNTKWVTKFEANTHRLPLSEVKGILDEHVPDFIWDGIYIDSNAYLNGVCTICKNECHPRLRSIQEKQGHCQTCGDLKKIGGYNSTIRERDAEVWKETPAYIYLVSFDLRGETVYKVGISANKDRVDTHVSRGATIIFKISMDLYAASVIEELILDSVDRLPNLNDDPDYPLDNGGTECFTPTPTNLKMVNSLIH